MKAFLFDVFGTVVDWRTGVARVAQEHFDRLNIDENPQSFATAWRAKYDPAMERIRSGGRGYVPLDILHRENLDQLLGELDLSEQFGDEDRASLNTAWEQLPPWPDSVPGIEVIRERAIVAPCSNGSIALMTRLARFANLRWDCILGAEIAGNYKPHRDAYLRSVTALGLEPNDVVMVAAHNPDLFAAREFGLKTAFIARTTEHGSGQTIDLEPEADWDFVVNELGDLARYAG